MQCGLLQQLPGHLRLCLRGSWPMPCRFRGLCGVSYARSMLKLVERTKNLESLAAL